MESELLLQSKEDLVDIFLRVFFISHRLCVAVTFFPHDCKAFSELTVPLKRGSRSEQRHRRSLEI